MGADLRGQLQAALGTMYNIERELGGGGMSRVFVAEEIALGRRVVIKLLAPELGEGLSAERFARETQVAAKLQHPHIVPLLTSGAAAGLLYYTMPYVEGESLAGQLKRERQLPLDVALRITRETAEALQYAHDCGLVHRDVKPGNILLSGGHALVTDFGIARALGAAAGERITATGVSIGTPAYMSPEQSAGLSADARSDVYSLGCVLYEMLAGEPPFTGPSAQAIIAKRLAEPPPRVSVVRRTVPGAVEDVLLTALATAPADRYQTAAAFAEALDDAALDTPESPRRRIEHRPERRRPWRIVAGGATALAIIMTTVAVAYGRRETDTSISPDRLAVLPFTTQGSSDFAATLGDGMTDLLSRDLDGLQRIRTVDPTVVIGRTHRILTRGALDAARAREIARALGAGLYVTGSVNVIGGRLRLQAALFANRDSTLTPGASSVDSTPITQASVEGDTSEVFALVDQLAADLVARRYRGPGNRLVETAASTTRSLTALRAYLDAEGHLRNTRFDSASIRYQRAIAADSGFALAYYRFAVALGLQGDWARAATASERAIHYAERLGERERRLVEAYGAFVRGEGDAAERAYRSLLADHPDDLEGRFLLGLTLFYYNPSRGRPIAEARPVFDEVLAADPEFLCAVCHMIELAGSEHDWPAYDSLWIRWARVNTPSHKPPLSARAVPAAARRDDSALRHAIAEAKDQWDSDAAWAVAAFSENPSAARAIIQPRFATAKSPWHRTTARWTLAAVNLAGGRWWEASRELVRAEEELTRGGIADPREFSFWHRAAGAALQPLPVPRASISGVRDEVAKWDASAPLMGATPGPMIPLRPHVRLYLLSVLDARLGAPDAAVRHLAALEKLSVPPGARVAVDHLVGVASASVASQRGNAAGVLIALDRIPSQLPMGYSVLEFVDLQARWLRAEALRTLGRDSEAIRWFASVPETSHIFGRLLQLALLAPSKLQMAELYERQGEVGRARELYGSFVYLWADADPDAQSVVRGAKERAARLREVP